MSVNAKYTDKYQVRIRNAFSKYWPSNPILHQELYASVYYFHKKVSQLDADNICKPVLDALKTVLYQDDKIVQLRRAGMFNIGQNTIDLLDLTKMPDYIVEEFFTLLDSSDHILYVEVGNLDYRMFEFGSE